MIARSQRPASWVPAKTCGWNCRSLGSFAGPDLVVSVDTDDQHVATGTGLLQESRMSRMEQLESADGEGDPLVIPPPAFSQAGETG
jgi:hypothetical protein